MIKQKCIPRLSYHPIRLAAFLSLLISSICALFFRENTPSSPFIAALNHYCFASCSILLLLTTSREGSARFFILVTILAALAVMLVLDCTIGQRTREELRVVCASLFTLPHCALLTSRVFADMREMAGVTRRVSVWDFVNGAIRLTYLCYFLTLVTLYSSVQGYGVVPWPFHACFLLAGIALFSLLMIRSLTSDPSLRAAADEVPRLPHVASGGTPDTYTKMYERLCNYLEEKKPFLKDNCQLEDISKAMCTNKSYLSRMIAMCSGMNFPKFMNSYRVRYSIELYKRNRKLKVSELAVRSGFHSTVSYNMSFKMFMNETPSEWCMEYTRKVMEEKGARRRGRQQSTQGESAGPGE